MPKAKAFPKTIYVTRESEGTDDEYLNIIDPDFANLDESTVVAVYDFTSMGRVEVSREFRWGDLKTAQKADSVRRGRQK
jgi:hypothetical protein